MKYLIILTLLLTACHERPGNMKKPETDKMLHGNWESVEIIPAKDGEKTFVKVWLNFTKYNQLKTQFLSKEGKIYKSTIHINIDLPDKITPKFETHKTDEEFSEEDKNLTWTYKVENNTLTINMGNNQMILKRIHIIPNTSEIKPDKKFLK